MESMLAMFGELVSLANLVKLTRRKCDEGLEINCNISEMGALISTTNFML
jgi:hypothetical protein